MITLDVILAASSVLRLLGTKQCISLWRGNLGPRAGGGRPVQTAAGSLAVLGSEYPGEPMGAKAEGKTGTGLWGPEERFFGGPPLNLLLWHLWQLVSEFRPQETERNAGRALAWKADQNLLRRGPDWK